MMTDVKVIILRIYYWVHNINGYNIYNNVTKVKKEQNYIGMLFLYVTGIKLV